ncbi:MAG: hypothetical protein TEF_21380 [Rhizobiales bacterium NRL2]|nr:MAG: hypothetical protein TEF_21380 [Rhizobiales bacterium NRL2]
MDARPVRVGVFQSGPGGRPTDRLARLARAMDDQSHDLVVCPELFMSGYNIGLDRIRERAEPADGPFAQAAADLARRRGTALAFGYPERDGDCLYNAAICIGADGGLLNRRRKLLLPPSYEGEVFAPGDQPPAVFEVAGLRCGMLICYEAEFPEAVRALARAGAEAILVPTALARQWRVVADAMIPARSFENGVWMVYADHAGEENGLACAGLSCIVSPFGEVRARAGVEDETLIGAVIDRDSVARAQARLPYLADLPTLLARIGPVRR